MTTITIDRAVVEQALEALEDARTFTGAWPTGSKAITNLRAALAQQAEPAQAISECIAVLRPMVKGKFPHEQALDELVGYTAPPQRKPLPKRDQHCVDVPGYGLTAVRLVRAVERAHGIKE